MEKECSDGSGGTPCFRWGYSSHHGLAARVRLLRQASASFGNCRDHFAELRKPARLRNSPQIFPLAPPVMPPAAATAHPPRFVQSLPSAWQEAPSAGPIPSARNRAAKDKPSLAAKLRALLIEVQCPRQPESNLHHLVCQLVRIEGAGGKVSRQFRAA
jgi:hypothetical protein